MKNLPIIFLVISVVVLNTGGCEIAGPIPELRRDNPIDASGTAFVPPSVNMTGGVVTGETVIKDTTHFQWTGNFPDERMLFSYRMDSSSWSPVSIGTTARYDLLEEGAHTFFVKGLYRNGEEQIVPTQISFTVDAVLGPELMFSPRKMSVRQGDLFDLVLRAEEMSEIAGGKIIVQYDKLMMIYQNSYLLTTGSGSLFGKNGGSAAADSVVANAEAGTVTFYLKLTGGSTSSVSGTGTIAALRFRAVGFPNTREQIIVGFGTMMKRADGTTFTVPRKHPAYIDIH